MARFAKGILAPGNPVANGFPGFSFFLNSARIPGKFNAFPFRKEKRLSVRGDPADLNR
jgi:hypothetical protein